MPAPRWVERRAGDARIRIPLCSACRRHARLDQAAGLLALAVGAVVAAWVHLHLFGLKLPTGLGLAGLTFVIVLLVAAVAIYAPLSWLLPGKHRACADSGWAVDFFSGSRDGGERGRTERTDEYLLRRLAARVAAEAPETHPLVFQSARYAAEFLTLNGGAETSVRIAEQG